MTRMRPDVARRALLTLIASAWFVATSITVTAGPPLFRAANTEPVRVVHWANGHPMDPELLPAFARRFNEARYRTSSGRPIEIEVQLVNSGRIRQELIHRITTGVPSDRRLHNPALVTPVVEQWLYEVNYGTGRTVIDSAETTSLAISWIGIATYVEMARCLGWPQQQLGFADIVALASHPLGWGQYPHCARAEWGSLPRVTYTDPNRSSTARSVLFTLFSAAAGKAPEQLTETDVRDDRVVEYVRQFQRSVTHYVPDTLVMMDEILAGPRYAHFFFSAEDNLAKLYRGKVVGTDPTLEALWPRRPPAGPLNRQLVLIYPKEGSTAHTHPAAFVRGEWVSEAERDGARIWVDYLRQDEQQRAFMDQGFRPSTALPLRCPICGEFGIEPRVPAAQIDPSRISPPVADQIVESWGDVKNPGVVVFVLDGSTAMSGQRFEAARSGVVRSLDTMWRRNHVGLLTFAEGVGERVAVGPVPDTWAAVADALRDVRLSRGSALFDAVQEAVQMADAAPAESTAIRGVIVLTASSTNTGGPLTNLIHMVSPTGVDIVSCASSLRGGACEDRQGASITSDGVRGLELAVSTRHPVGIYFIGVGEETDFEAGRVMAEATQTIPLPQTGIEGLSEVIKLFIEYF
jgi:Ca-activated chloride channel homolog